MLENCAGMERGAVLEFANGLGAGQFVRRGETFLCAYAHALDATEEQLVAFLNAAPGEYDTCWVEAMDEDERARLLPHQCDGGDGGPSSKKKQRVDDGKEESKEAREQDKAKRAGSKGEGGGSVLSTVVYEDLSKGGERFPVPCIMTQSSSSSSSSPTVTYCPRNLNRTIISDEGVMAEELLDRSAEGGVLSRQRLADNLRQYHREINRLFALRKLACAGVDTTAASAAANYGCGKCRWTPKGCGRCRAEGFEPGPREGRIGGIPKPASEHTMAVLGDTRCVQLNQCCLYTICALLYLRAAAAKGWQWW